MSFSSRTKGELSRLPIDNRCCPMAELAAIVRMNSTIQINKIDQVSLKFNTENAAIARRIFILIKTLYNSNVEVIVKKNRQLKKNNKYMIVVKDRDVTKGILKDVGFLIDDDSYCIIDHGLPEDLVDSRCCRRSYIRGAFLGGGSISNPEKSYHMEFVTSHEEYAKDLSNIINSFNLNSKIVMRRDDHVVYVKEGEQIVDILNIMGAHQALLRVENIRAMKDVRNNINRIVNCETANLDKTINASMRQVENIEYIDDVMGLDKLSKNLREIAELRLAHREASLKELGAMLSVPVGKSGVNYRLRRIEEIAERLRGKEKYNAGKRGNIEQ